MITEGGAATPIQMSPSTSRASTFQGAWLDVREYEGDIIIIQDVGAVTGSITGSIEDATDISGTANAALSGATFTAVSSANNLQKLVIPAGQPRGFIRYVGTIVTGPALCSVSLLSRKKYI
jgi:hypothetical protein